MLIVLSPAKTLDYSPQSLTRKHTTPEFLDDSQELIDVLAKKSKSQVGKLMGLSDKLAELNVERFQRWEQPFDTSNAKQALLAFKGDVYQGLELEEWKAPDFTYAQKHIRILSGLYGVLRPLDLMQPYRLEMGTKLKTDRGRDLYTFWGDSITQAINLAIHGNRTKVLVNLASNEYYSAVKSGQIDAPIVTPVFKDEKNGKYKVISFFAKKARGMMADYIVRNRVTKTAALKDFDVSGYRFEESESDDSTFTFFRNEAV